jgi:UDP-glucose 4-epimerase
VGQIRIWPKADDASMKALVTGSSGHLGEALVRRLRAVGHEVVGLDIREGRFTTRLGSITDRRCVAQCMSGVQWVFHAATLHRPHVDIYSRQDFVDTNITGTLTLLEQAAATGVESFVFTSTTSVFGDALVPPAGTAAAWVTEEVKPIPKNIYGVTKAVAEDLCQLFHRNQGLPCIVLRTSRFFPEEDLDEAVRAAYTDDNIKVSEYLYRRVDLADAVDAHLLAAERAPALGFRRYIVSATTPFLPDDLSDLRADAAVAVRRRVPAYEAEYARRGWKMLPSIDRVYVNERARNELGWRPRYDFTFLINRLRAGEDVRSPLARLVGSKGYR